MTPTHDLRIMHSDTITPPKFLRRQVPLTEAGAQTVARSRQAIVDTLEGRSQRVVVVVGPCSIHDPQAGLEYARKLQPLRERYREDLEIVLRAYFEKPRTTVGWKGLINDPHLDGSYDMETGMRLALQFLVDCTTMGLPTATEFLDPITPHYLAQAVSWAAIGARTTESQTHRELASGLSMPVGFKNGTDGSLSVAIHALQSASAPHAFRGINDEGQVSVLHTTGNPHVHVVLRGSDRGTNYDAASVAAAAQAAQAKGCLAKVMVDASHGNSSKDHRRQGRVLADLCAQLQAGSTALCGVMIESFLLAGRQDLSPALTYGQSITDACLGWDETAALLEQLAQAARTRRALGAEPGLAEREALGILPTSALA